MKDYTPFNGLIDDVKIYNYALTAEQIKMLYNEGSAVLGLGLRQDYREGD